MALNMPFTHRDGLLLHDPKFYRTCFSYKIDGRGRTMNSRIVSGICERNVAAWRDEHWVTTCFVLAIPQDVHHAIMMPEAYKRFLEQELARVDKHITDNGHSGVPEPVWNPWYHTEPQLPE